MSTERERTFANALRDAGGTELAVASAIGFSRFMRALDAYRLRPSEPLAPIFFAYGVGQATGAEVFSRTGGLGE